MRKDEQNVKKIIMILLMVTVSLIGAMIWANGGYHKDGILQLGEVYEVPVSSLFIENEEGIYDENAKEFVAKAEAVELYFNVDSKNSDWNYFVVNFKKKDYSANSVKLDFMDGDQALLTSSVVLRSGKNILKTPVHGKISTVRMTFYSGLENRFRIGSIQLRQKYFDIEDFMKKAVVIFLICTVCYLVVSAGKRIDWYVAVEVLQNFFIFLGNALGSRMSAVLNQRRRKKLQTACFTVMFLLTIVMNVISGNDYSVSGQYWMLCFGALFLFTGILSYHKPLQKQNWRTGTCLIGMLLWGVAALSDLFVKKNIPYVGYVLALCGGFAFFIWWNEKEFKSVLYRMIRGLEWTLPFIVAYCMIFRPKEIGILYNGCFPQRESMSMYALALLIAFLADGKIQICQKEFHWRSLFVIGVGASFSGFYLYYSDTIWCNLSAFAVIAIWAADLLYQRSLWRKKIKKLIVTGIFMLLYAAVLIVGVKYLIKELPGSLGTELVYENEVQETKLSEEEMYAVESEHPGWLEGITRENGQERKDLWRVYVQKLNLIGNADNLREGERYVNPSNGILQMAYRYGMFILVPYLAFLIIGIYWVWKQKSFLWCAVLLSYLAGIMLGDIEIPYAQPLWIMFYFGMGQFLSREKIENEK